MPLSELNGFMDEVTRKLGRDTKAAQLFMNCYPNTIATTTRIISDDDTFVFTGDIHAMWLRDSSAQVRHYLPLAGRSEKIRRLIVGLSHRQMRCILTDPYANAYNEEPDFFCYKIDETRRNGYVYERKYEIDSLCYPIQLAYLLYRETGCTDHLDANFRKAARLILSVWETEQHHGEKSLYHFQRTECPPSDTLPCEGHGNPVKYTGMTWSGFRPSDDACRYGYLIPSNMFAAVVLGYLQELSEEVLHDGEIADRAGKLEESIREGIRNYGIIDHPVYGQVYAYEVDGLGGVNLMDDANVPSLLSIPYLGFTTPEDPIYRNTRRMILSHENPYYYEGKVLSGIGSPHTPPDHVWPIALSMQGLTTNDPEEVRRIFELLLESDGGELYMHEGVHVDDPTRFTRPWFAWSNSLFSEFVLHYLRICT